MSRDRRALLVAHGDGVGRDGVDAGGSKGPAYVVLAVGEPLVRPDHERPAGKDGVGQGLAREHEKRTGVEAPCRAGEEVVEGTDIRQHVGRHDKIPRRRVDVAEEVAEFADIEIVVDAALVGHLDHFFGKVDAGGMGAHVPQGASGQAGAAAEVQHAREEDGTLRLQPLPDQ